MPGPRNDLVHRAHADDLAQRPRDIWSAAPSQELADSSAGAQKLSGQIDVEHCVPLRQRHFRKRGIALQSGIGDHDVERAELGARVFEHLGDLMFVGHVGAQRDGSAAASDDLSRDGVGLLLSGDIVDGNVSTGVGHCQCDPFANTGIGIGNEGLLAGKWCAGEPTPVYDLGFPDVHLPLRCLLSER